MEMQGEADDVGRRKMEELRLICEREVPTQQQRIHAAVTSFKSSLDGITMKSHQTVQIQARVGKLRAELREMEDALVKVLAVKTRKEAKRMHMVDSLSVTKSKIDELQSIVEDQRARKDEYASIICEQSKALMACEEKYSQNIERREEVEEAMSWYNRVLGFHIVCGHGVKFVFTNIDSNCLDEEYSFTIRHENDVYTMLDCNPILSDTKELINELNKSNGLFKFVRIIRDKFQEMAGCGMHPQVTIFDDQDTSTISLSAPVSSASTGCKSESPAQQIEPQAIESKKQTKRVNYGITGRQGVLSPRSALSVGRSSRRKAKK